MLCGHAHGGGRLDMEYEGRKVYILLQDYQGRGEGYQGGGSWLRYYSFSPKNNTITAKTYQVRDDEFETDTDSEFVLEYDMQSTHDWVELDTQAISSGQASATAQYLDWCAA